MFSAHSSELQLGFDLLGLLQGGVPLRHLLLHLVLQHLLLLARELLKEHCEYILSSVSSVYIHLHWELCSLYIYFIILYHMAYLWFTYTEDCVQKCFNFSCLNQFQHAHCRTENMMLSVCLFLCEMRFCAILCDFVGHLKCSFVLWQEASFANASEASAIWFVVKFNQVRCQILIFDIPSEFAFDCILTSAAAVSIFAYLLSTISLTNLTLSAHIVILRLVGV